MNRPDEKDPRPPKSDDFTRALITIYSSPFPTLVRCKDDARFPEAACLIAAMFSRLGFRTVIAMAPRGEVHEIEKFKASKFSSDQFEIVVGWQYLEAIDLGKASSCDVLVVDARRRTFPEVFTEGTLAGTSLVLIDTEAMLPPEKPTYLVDDREFLTRFGKVYDSSFFKNIHGVGGDYITKVDLLDSISLDVARGVADVVAILHDFPRPHPLGSLAMRLILNDAADPAFYKGGVDT